MSDLIIFGCGYIGSRVARAALAAGRRVRCCTRSVGKLEPLRQLGAELHHIDAAKPKQFGPALSGLASPTVLYALPPIPDMPGGEVPRRATQAAITANAQSFVYLSSAGVYGQTATDDWVDEQTGIALDDPAMSGYQAEEAAISAATSAGLRTVTLRLPAVYGPGRGVRARLRKGDYTMVDDGQHWFSRIHVDDLARIIFASEEKAPPGAIYLVSDDKPTQQREHAAWIAEHLKLPMPRSVPSFAPGTTRTAIRGRRIRNELLKKELGLTLAYPTYVEGEKQIDSEEGDLEKTMPVRAVLPPPSTVASAPPASAARPRPDTIKHVGELASEWHGVRVVVLPPGQKFLADKVVYVVEGTPTMDGHRLKGGDLVAKGELTNAGPGDARLLMLA
jgi:nucleoside-diphosphate-sugar epimerase